MRTRNNWFLASSKYNVTNLVYYEMAETAEGAIARERQLYTGPRRRKLDLINSMNPMWQNLSVEPQRRAHFNARLLRSKYSCATTPE